MKRFGWPAPMLVFVDHDEPATRTGTREGDVSSSESMASGLSTHQHETQAHATANESSSPTLTGAMRGALLMANAATAPTPTSAAPMNTAGFMPSTNCWPEP